MGGSSSTFFLKLQHLKRCEIFRCSLSAALFRDQSKATTLTTNISHQSLRHSFISICLLLVLKLFWVLHDKKHAVTKKLGWYCFDSCLGRVFKFDVVQCNPNSLIVSLHPHGRSIFFTCALPALLECVRFQVQATNTVIRLGTYSPGTIVVNQLYSHRIYKRIGSLRWYSPLAGSGFVTIYN